MPPSPKKRQRSPTPSRRRAASPAAKRARTTKKPRLMAKQVFMIEQCIKSGRPYYHPVHRCYKLGYVKLKGGETWLRELLYSHYVYPTHVGGGGFGGGIGRGSKVDKAISLWAASEGRVLPRIQHRFVLHVMNAFRQWRWTPVAGQHVVCSAKHRLGTAIDVLVRDARGRLLAIELKTGFHGYWTKAQGNLQAPLQGIPNCPKHHALLQLALGLTLYNRPDCTDGYVVRVDTKGVYRYPVVDWARIAVRNLLSRL